MSTFARRTPSIILSKAASTPADGPAAVAVVVRFGVVGVGDASGFAAFVTGFGVGVGFASTERVRLEGDVVVPLCADARARLANTIEATATNLFMILAPPI
jgi:hypothetical protein